MATYNAKYRIKNANGDYDIVYLETTSEQVIESEERMFVTQEEKQAIKNYTHNQVSASKIWTIGHNLNRFPQVTIVDSANSMVMGEVKYISTDILQVEFQCEFAGTAYLS